MYAGIERTKKSSSSECNPDKKDISEHCLCGSHSEFAPVGYLTHKNKESF